jgi:hypothetical protein
MRQIKWPIFEIILIMFSFFSVLIEPAFSDSGAMEGSPGQIIGGEIILGAGGQNEISIIAPDLISGWTMNPSNLVSTKEASLTIEATGDWQVVVSANAATGGYAAEYDKASTQFVPDGKRMKNPMTIRAEDGDDVDLSKGGILTTGSGNKVVTITLTQAATAEDKPLPEGRDYRLILTFTGSPA